MVRGDVQSVVIQWMLFTYPRALPGLVDAVLTLFAAPASALEPNTSADVAAGATASLCPHAAVDGRIRGTVPAVHAERPAAIVGAHIIFRDAGRGQHRRPPNE